MQLFWTVLFSLIAGACVAFGLGILYANWRIAILGMIGRPVRDSWTPLVGPIAICLGLATLCFIYGVPIRHLLRWGWITLIIDWGTVPGTVRTVWYHVQQSRLHKATPVPPGKPLHHAGEQQSEGVNKAPPC